jgi:hypothetical protein
LKLGVQTPAGPKKKKKKKGLMRRDAVSDRPRIVTKEETSGEKD